MNAHIPGRLEYCRTVTDGEHIMLVAPDHTVTFVGVLWGCAA